MDELGGFNTVVVRRSDLIVVGCVSETQQGTENNSVRWLPSVV